MTKKCTICNTDKDVEDFNKHSGKKDGLQPACKSCNIERSKAYYARNKEHHQQIIGERNKRLQILIRSKLDAYKKEVGCSLCPENEPVCLDFHHHEDKENAVSRLIGQASIRRAEKEIAKCSLLCSNCHRKLHGGLISYEKVNQMRKCAFSFGKLHVD